MQIDGHTTIGVNKAILPLIRAEHPPEGAVALIVVIAEALQRHLCCRHLRGRHDDVDVAIVPARRIAVKIDGERCSLESREGDAALGKNCGNPAKLLSEMERSDHMSLAESLELDLALGRHTLPAEVGQC